MKVYMSVCEKKSLKYLLIIIIIYFFFGIISFSIPTQYG